MRKFFASFVAAIAICTLVPVAPALAANITWSSAIAVGNGSDVANLGKVVEAQYATGATSETVNGVTFQPGFTNYATPNGETTGALNGGSTGNAAYNTILDAFAYDGTNPGVLTLTGLSIGTKYEIQLWGLDNRTDGESTRTMDFTGGANTSATYAEGAHVSFTGLFIADATTQVIDVNGVDQAGHNLNAFALTTITPEPASLVALVGLGGMGLLGLVIRRRRRTA